MLKLNRLFFFGGAYWCLPSLTDADFNVQFSNSMFNAQVEPLVLFRGCVAVFAFADRCDI